MGDHYTIILLSSSVHIRSVMETKLSKTRPDITSNLTNSTTDDDKK